MNDEITYLHRLRAAELERVLTHLPDRDGRLLEIGGGDGYQASLLARYFASVELVDISAAERTWFPIRLYDGRHLPFGPASFDVVFSSHAMEHIPHFADLQSEIARVLKTDGIVLHVMPSAAWRFWTLLAHYPASVGFAVSQLGARPGPDRGRRRRTMGSSLRRALLAMPHGEMGGVFSELRGFSRRAWVDRFAAAGWRVLKSVPLGYFYTGYVLFGDRLGLAARRRLAKVFGSSSMLYVVVPDAGRRVASMGR